MAQGNLFFPLVYGQALAYAMSGHFAWTGFAFCLAFGLVDQAYILFLNDVADEASDRGNTSPSPYSGGSRVLVEGKLSARSLCWAGLGAGALLVLLSAAGAVVFNAYVLLPACLLALLLVWLYSFSPARLAYRGHGEVLQALGLGVVLPFVGYAAQQAPIALMPWTALLPTLALGYAGNIATSLPDFPSDSRTGKRSYPVRTSQRNARSTVLLLLLAAALAAPHWLPRVAAEWSTWWWYVPVLPLLPAACLWKNADTTARRRCLVFVSLTLLSSVLAFGIWAAALFSAGSVPFAM